MSGGLGEPVSAISGAIASAITAIAGVITENVILAIIGAIGAAIAAAIGAAAYIIVNARQQDTLDKAIEEGVTAESSTVAPDGSIATTRVGGAALPESLADKEVGPPGSPPVDADTRRAESASSSSGGFPVVPVALAAGVALLLLSRR